MHTLFHEDGRVVAEDAARLVDIRATALRIVRQIFAVLTLGVGHFTLIAKDVAACLDIDFSKLGDTYLRLLNTDVEIVVCAMEHDLQIAADAVGDIAECACRTSVGENLDVAAFHHVEGEVSRYTLVADAHARAIVVEWPHDTYRHVVFLCEEHAHRLTEALALIVAGTRPRGADVAVVILRGRHMSGIGIAVELTRREEEEALHAPLLVEVEQTAQTPDVGVERLDRVFAVEHRRGDTCHVDDEVGLAGSRHILYLVFDDVKLLDVEALVGFHRLYPAGIAEHEIVERNDFLDAQLVGLSLEEMHEIIAEEAPATCDENGGTLQLGLLLSCESCKRMVKILP